ncbi:MAG: MarR family transcriptional regulator [Eubacteriales bacterium]|nr:MarR family transcriptional regulator [Eubacteriales bacterium]
MQSLHYLLMKSHACLSRRIFSRAQQELGLSPGQPKVLDFLLENEGSDQKTIAANCEIEQATLGSILLRMEEKGLIERRRQPGNRRSLFVYLTDSGKETARKMNDIFRMEDQIAASHLNEAQLAELLDLLESVCKGIHDKNNQEADNN